MSVLSIILKLNASGVAQGLSQVRDRINTISAPVNRVGSALNAWGGYAIAGGLAAIGTVAAVTAGKVISMGSSMEQTRLALSTMMGSAEAGNQILSKFNTFANVTPFDNDQVIRAGKTLLSYGMNANQAMRALKMIGDVSSGTGKDFNELSLIYGKVFSKGKMDTETMNQMTEAGIPIIQKLGKRFNTTGEEIYKMAEEGKLSAGIVAEMFAEMTNAGGLFEDMMQKQSQTTLGMWSTLIGTLQMVGAEIGESLMPLMKAALSVTQQWVEEFSEFHRAGKVIEWMSAIGLTGVTVVGELTKAWNVFATGMSELWRLLGLTGTMAMNSLIVVISSALLGVLSMTEDVINKIITGFNKIPGVKIGTVDWSGATDPLDSLGESASFELERDASAFGDKKAYEDLSVKNASIDKMMETVGEKILSWQSIQLDNRHNLNTLEDRAKKAEPATDTVTSSEPLQKDKKPKRMGYDADRLTKMGLYNVNLNNRIKNPLDIERNGLLREAVALLRRNREPGVIV